jgi:hypothetical protein
MKPMSMWVAVVLSCCVVSLAHAQSPRLVRSAQFLVSTEAAPAPSPCDDSLLVSLQGRALDSLSAREYEYFMLKTKECGEYRKAAMAGSGPERRSSRTRQVGISSFNDSAPEPDGNGLALLGVTLGILALVAVISIGASAQHIVIF